MIITPQDAARLDAVLRRDSRSLLQYSRESFPWVRTGTEAPLVRLRGIMDRDRDAQQALGRFLTRQRHTAGPPGSYPMGFTSLNFVSLAWLLPRLVQEQKAALAALEQERDAFDEGLARLEVERLIEGKRQTVRDLERLAADVTAPAPAEAVEAAAPAAAGAH